MFFYSAIPRGFLPFATWRICCQRRNAGRYFRHELKKFRTPYTTRMIGLRNLAPAQFWQYFELNLNLLKRVEELQMDRLPLASGFITER